MSEIKDGGRAYPWCGDLNETPFINLGMSLRDWLAGKALGGLTAALADATVRDWILRNAANEEVDSKLRLARAAYEYADAMLKARGQS